MKSQLLKHLNPDLLTSKAGLTDFKFLVFLDNNSPLHQGACIIIKYKK